MGARHALAEQDGRAGLGHDRPDARGRHAQDLEPRRQRERGEQPHQSKLDDGDVEVIAWVAPRARTLEHYVVLALCVAIAALLSPLIVWDAWRRR